MLNKIKCIKLIIILINNLQLFKFEKNKLFKIFLRNHQMNDKNRPFFQNEYNKPKELIINSNLEELNEDLYKAIFSSQPEKDKTKENGIIFLNKKTPRFKVQKEEKYKDNISSDDMDINTNEGKWTNEENDAFLDAIDKYGIKWDIINSVIKTRKLTQIKSHAKKIFQKLKICKDEKYGLDFTIESIYNIKDMINYIKSLNKNYNIKKIFKYFYDKVEYKQNILTNNLEQKSEENLGLFYNNINLNPNNKENLMINNINNSNQSLNHSNNDIFRNTIKFQNNINLNLSNYNFYNISFDNLSLNLLIIIAKLLITLNSVNCNNNINLNNNISNINNPFNQIISRLIILNSLLKNTVNINQINLNNYLNINNLINRNHNIILNNSIMNINNSNIYSIKK